MNKSRMFFDLSYMFVFIGICTFTIIVIDEQVASALSIATQSSGERYGIFNWLDHRSDYGQGLFPEPFLVDDSDLEVNEDRIDWLHTEKNNQQSDTVKAEVEKGFGLLTVELEVPFESDTSQGQTSQGIGNASLGARYPVHQFISDKGFVDSTFGIAIEIGTPINTDISKNTELVPKIFNDLKLGDHFTLQSIFGYSKLFGGGDDGGLQTFEYSFVFGYRIPKDELALPGVQQFVPIFELKGETELNKDDSGHNNLIGNMGFRFNCKDIGQVLPRPGLGFVFPIDKGARMETHWGIVTSLVLEY
ncbi:MAG: hypothetical protein PHE88_01700 [Elusimicrobia bacterium]|nr:hypothetical protein [Elusimicrobiota bacterium]